ncbi:MAG: SatD family protein [Bacteroidales bacterium]|nr:SatD family protein [Bacteroidales bacterium]
MHPGNYYILMADIVGSRKKEGYNLMQGFKNLVEETTVQHKNRFLSPMTITLGDEFQSIVKSLQDGIEMIFKIEEYRIKKKLNFELRYVLNYGKIDTSINKQIAYEMMGGGLIETRENLKKLKSQNQNYLVLLDNDKLQYYLNDLFLIYHSFISHWGRKDYEIISAFIEYKDYKQVAKLVGKDASSTWRKEKTLRMKEYFTLKKLIQSIAHEKFD